MESMESKERCLGVTSSISSGLIMNSFDQEDVLLNKLGVPLNDVNDNIVTKKPKKKTKKKSEKKITIAKNKHH